MILALRRRQARNFIGILMLSQGVLMLLSGDEILRSKDDNNNICCQDNELSCFDWSQVPAQRLILEYVRGLIALRRRHPNLTHDRFLTGAPGPGQDLLDIAWHGLKFDIPRWSVLENRALAFTLAGVSAAEPPLHVMLNMWEDALEFAVPAPPRPALDPGRGHHGGAGRLPAGHTGPHDRRATPRRRPRLGGAGGPPGLRAPAARPPFTRINQSANNAKQRVSPCNSE